MLEIGVDGEHRKLRNWSNENCSHSNRKRFRSSTRLCVRFSVFQGGLAYSANSFPATVFQLQKKTCCLWVQTVECSLKFRLALVYPLQRCVRCMLTMVNAFQAFESAQSSPADTVLGVVTALSTRNSPAQAEVLALKCSFAHCQEGRAHCQKAVRGGKQSVGSG